MKIRFAFPPAALVVAVLCVSGASAAMPTAVERKINVVAGDSFRMNVVLAQDLKTEGGELLRKGPYEILVSSLGGDKSRATFFQGGLRKGEANGIIVVQKNQNAHVEEKFQALGLGPGSVSSWMPPLYRKMNLKIGAEGGNQILIGLLLPAVQPTR